MLTTLGKRGHLVTSTGWSNLSYYGKKLKTDFTHLNTLVAKAKEKESLDEIEIDTLLKMMKHKTTIALTITKIVDLMDTTKRLEDIEKIIEAISPEALLEAKLSVAK